jgi:uncharacterized protein
MAERQGKDKARRGANGANGHAPGNPAVAGVHPLGKGRDAGEPVPGTGKIAERVQFNCAKCPGFCCSYPVIVITKRDLERLAKYFRLSPEEAEKRFTKSAHGYKRIMRRKRDTHFPMICQFFDTERRRCTIYEARPAACRAYPGSARCGYYDFLSFERRAQGDPEFVARTDYAG